MDIEKYKIIQPNKGRGDYTWYGCVLKGGQTKRSSLDTADKKIAQTWLTKMESQKFLPESMREKPLAQKVDPKILLTQYRSSLARLHRGNKNTMDAYDFRLAHMKSFVEGVKDLDAVTGQYARRWVEDLDLAPKTVREVVARAKGFWARMIEDGHAKEDVFKGIKLPKNRKKERPFWIPAEVDAILAAAPDAAHRGFWGSMAYAGLRHAEADALTWGQVDFKRMEIRLLGKGSKMAVIPISEKLRMLLLALAEGKTKTEKCFRGIGNFKSNRLRTLQVSCKDMVFEVPGPLTLHRFRHSFASNLLRAGAGVKSVQALMRHESATITLDTYGHLLQSDLSSVTNLI